MKRTSLTLMGYNSELSDRPFLEKRSMQGGFADSPIIKKFISKAPSPLPSPARGEGCNISPPLRGGDKGEGDVCGFTNDRSSNRSLAALES
jgi:hypothetical protein